MSKPEPLTKKKRLIIETINFETQVVNNTHGWLLKIEDVKSAVEWLLREIEKEKHEIGKEYGNLPYRRNPLEKNYLKGYVDGLIRAEIKIKKAFEGVLE